MNEKTPDLRQVEGKPDDWRGTYIVFELAPQDRLRKTQTWLVRNPSDDRGVAVSLGAVQWFGRWRKYGFYPAAGTVFEEVCLQEIAHFVFMKTLCYKTGTRWRRVQE